MAEGRYNMTVDTAAMRRLADEIDKLRDTLIVERSLRVKSERELEEMRAKVAQYASENKMADDAAKALVEKYDEEKRRREWAEGLLVREMLGAHFARFGGKHE